MKRLREVRVWTSKSKYRGLYGYKCDIVIEVLGEKTKGGKSVDIKE